MPLPFNARTSAESFTRLDADTKQRLLEEVESHPPGDQDAMIKILSDEGGVTAEFIAHVLSKDAPMKGESRNNKKRNAMHTK